MKRLLSGLGSIFVAAIFAGTTVAHAQSGARRIVLRSGDSVELRNYLFVVNCQSIVIGTPQLDVIEAPAEVTVTLKEKLVFPRPRKCPKPIPGETVVATAKDVAEPKEANLTIRVNFNTKDGERQGSNTYILSLLPAGGHSGEIPRMNFPTNTPESTMPATAQ